MSNKKSMSFGKLMGIFGGAMLALLLITVLVIKMMSGPKKDIVTSRKVSAQQSAEVAQPAETDIFAERERQAALDAQSAAAANAAQTQQTLQQQIEAMSLDLESLRNRVDGLEAGQRRNNQLVVKPTRRAASRPDRRYPAGSSVLPTTTGYKVQATVGGRAWIASGGGEDSVRAGDALPNARIESVDADTGVVVSPRNR